MTEAMKDTGSFVGYYANYWLSDHIYKPVWIYLNKKNDKPREMKRNDERSRQKWPLLHISLHIMHKGPFIYDVSIFLDNQQM